MDYAGVVPHIPKDVYDLIQIFFNQIYLSKIEDWDKYWKYDPVESMQFIHENLLKKLTEDLLIIRKSDDIKRTITMLLKLCMLTFYNYQQAIRWFSIYRNRPFTNKMKDIERRTQSQIMKNLFGCLQSGNSLFDLNDEHFAMVLNRFFYVDIVQGGRNEEIRKLLKLVFLEFILFYT